MSGSKITGPHIDFVQRIDDLGIGKYCLLFIVFWELKTTFFSEKKVTRFNHRKAAILLLFVK